MAQICILGAGLAGIPMALEMRLRARPKDHVIVINNTNKCTFVPSHPWAAAGWRKPKDIDVPLKSIFKRRNINLIATAAQKVLVDQNTIELVDGRFVPYDYLVIATGPSPAFDAIAGMDRHTNAICRGQQAIATYSAWQQFVEKPGPIVLGAVQDGSCFGPVYEYALILETDLRRRKIRSKTPITFITAEPYLGHLGLGGTGATRQLLESVFQDHGIQWICNARVDRVDKKKITVSELDPNGKARYRHCLDHGFAMLMPSFRGVAAVAGIQGLVTPEGFVMVNTHQANHKYPNIFAVGSCVNVPAVEKTPVPTGPPKTGFMIESMISTTARNIRALLEGQVPECHATCHALHPADPDDKAVGFVAIPQIPPRNVKWASKGRHIHLSKIAFEKYFQHKVRAVVNQPFHEKRIVQMLGLNQRNTTQAALH